MNVLHLNVYEELLYTFWVELVEGGRLSALKHSGTQL